MGGIFQEYDQTTDAGAIYAQARWGLIERLTLEAGMRWNFENKDIDLFSGPTATGYPFDDVQPPPFSASRSANVAEDAPTGNVTLTYEPIPDVRFYVKYAHGCKGAHLNGGVLGTVVSSAEDLLEPVRPEEVDAVEIGMKAASWDTRYQLSVIGFYYDYKNLQIFQLKNEAGGVPLQTLVNAKESDVFGVEVEVNLIPLEGHVPEAFDRLQIFGSFAWLKSRYTDFKNVDVNSSPGGPIPTVDDFSGNQLINAPEFSFAGYVQWRVDVGDIGLIGPRLDWSYKDRVFFNQNNFKELSQDPLWLLILRLDYSTPDGMVEVSGWVRNLLDETYVADAINLTNFNQKILYAIGDPRTYGMTLSLMF